MHIQVEESTLSTVSADLLVVGIPKVDIEASQEAPTLGGVAAELDEATGGRLKALIDHEAFRAETDSTLRVPVEGLAAPWLLLVGLGDLGSVHERCTALAKALAQQTKGQRHVAVLAPECSDECVERLATAVHLATYAYLAHKTDAPTKAEQTLAIVVTSGDARTRAEQPLETARILGESVNLARDLVNAPPNTLRPSSFASQTEELAKRYGLSCEVFDHEALAAERMALFLAVGQGSDDPPKMVKLHYAPQAVGSWPKVALVGKGLTFDAGGLCLKPAKSMSTMKLDMGGAATTLGTIVAAARLQLPVEITAYLGIAENMPSGAAYRPGDVYTSRSGRTVEIINTDAEGRLVLADVLDYAREQGPDAIIDHATLTGACMVALGPYTAGLFSNRDVLRDIYARSASAVGESLWPMPLSTALRDMLKSDIADVKHTGEAYGGSITAALFLEHFVGDVPWVHMDIAGPSFLDKPQGLDGRGGTGFGVRTGVQVLREIAAGALAGHSS